MKSLITYFIKYPINGNVVLIMLLIFGFIGLKSLRSTFFPQVPSRNISIEVVYPGSSPEEIEEGIVTKIEDNLKGISGIDQVTSSSTENRGTVTIEVLKGFNTDLVLQDVKNAVDRINSFPVGMETPVIYKREQTSLAISFALSGDVDLLTLKRAARAVEDSLRKVPGISKVDLGGFPNEEIEISISEDMLRSYQMTNEQVVRAIRNANLELTGGTIVGEDREILIRAKAKKYRAFELRNIVLKADENGRVIRLEDVAKVVDSWEDNPNRSHFNGNPATTITVNNTNSEDILFITDYVKAFLERYNKRQDLVHADVIRDQSVTLTQRIDLLVNNGLIGVVLVLIFLAFFLNTRLAFWVAMALPVSFAGMFILASFAGITINVISLFGMILVIGILVDDGIVISENIFRHFENGKGRIEAAVLGTMEVLPAVLSAILTTMAAFSAFFFIDGRLGDFFAEMSFIVIATLLFSLIEGALILPAHVAHSKALTKGGGGRAKFLQFMDRLMDGMKNRLYAPILQFTFKYPLMAFSIPVFMLMASFGLVGGGFVKTTFFPFIESDNVKVTLVMPSGTRGPVIEKWMEHIEASIWRVNDAYSSEREDGLNVVQSIERNVGSTGRFQGTLNISLLDGETRNIKTLELTNAFRKETGPVYGAEQLAFGSSSPFGKPISVSLLGEDLDQMRQAADSLVISLRTLTSLKDVADNDPQGLDEVNITLKDKAYLLGLDLREVLSQVRQGFFGNEVQRIQRGVDEVKVWVRYGSQERSTIGQLEDMRIRLASGREYPLTEIANLEVKKGVVSINHLNGIREIKVQADQASAGVSISDVTQTVQDSIVPAVLASYPTVIASYEGQNREQAKTSKSIGPVMLVILLLMLCIVIFTFRSLPQTLAVFLLIPFGLIGVIGGHWIHGAQISLFSALGIIALIGILINDALVFMAAFNNLLKEGRTFDDALYEASLSRFRPIVLTSITTIAGLAPLIADNSFQAQFLIPMAIAVAYGLLLVTGIILVVLPVYLIAINKMRVFEHYWRTGVRKDPASLEPAVKEQHGLEEYEDHREDPDSFEPAAKEQNGLKEYED